MRTAPAFWSYPPDRPGLVSRLVSPLSWIWRLVTARRVARAPTYKAGIPVICVGNISAGGTGKTPVVAALMERLAARGVAAHALSRGYGGRLEGPVRVDPAEHSAGDVGDEPLLLAGFGPAWVARDRGAGARAIEAAGADVIVMDDGFQNPELAKDLGILVVDAEAGLGNGRVIPAGPLREPAGAAMARADLMISIGPEAAQETLSTRYPALAEGTRLRGRLAPLQTGMPWEGLVCFAFAGIGRPEKFFDTLEAVGADVRARRSFPDHADYAPALVRRLISEAWKMGAQPVTTEKDAVRIPAEMRSEVLVLPVRLDLEDWAGLDAALDRILAPRTEA